MLAKKPLQNGCASLSKTRDLGSIGGSAEFAQNCIKKVETLEYMI